MMDNYILRRLVNGKSIVGYRWDLEVPKAIVLWLHGLGESALCCDEMSDYFAQNDIMMMSMDLRGHGLSGVREGDCFPRSSIITDVDALVKYAKEQYPDTPLILCGYSLGGNIGLDYRIRGNYNHLVDGYIMISPWLLLYRMPTKMKIRGAKIFGDLVPGRKVNFHSQPLHDETDEASSKADYFKQDMITIRAAVETIEIGMKIVEGNRYPTEEVMNKPFLLMHGAKDVACNVDGSRVLAAHENAVRINASEQVAMETLVEIMDERDIHSLYIEWGKYGHEMHRGNEEDDGKDVLGSMVEFINETVISPKK